MTRFFWTKGRLAWPFVSAIVLLSLALLVADLAWRIFVVPAESLALVTAGACIVLVLAIVGLRPLFRRGDRSS
jgi:hypothetical protein